MMDAGAALMNDPHAVVTLLGYNPTPQERVADVLAYADVLRADLVPVSKREKVRRRQQGDPEPITARDLKWFSLAGASYHDLIWSKMWEHGELSEHGVRGGKVDLNAEEIARQVAAQGGDPSKVTEAADLSKRLAEARAKGLIPARKAVSVDYVKGVSDGDNQGTGSGP